MTTLPDTPAYTVKAAGMDTHPDTTNAKHASRRLECGTDGPLRQAKLPPLIPIADYSRIYQVVFSVLEASGSVVTRRACTLFALAGANILRKHYKRQAFFGAGTMALMIEADPPTTAIYGRFAPADTVEASHDGFHAWVECDGWLIDFMSPIMGEPLKEDGHQHRVPRRMLQKRICQRKDSLSDMQCVGDFHFERNPLLEQYLIDKLRPGAVDLLGVCSTWYRRPPKRLRDLAILSNDSQQTQLALRAPSVDGVW